MFVEESNNIVNYDVKVTNAYKSYGTNKIVLNGLNMNVTSGSIYGLLGPSGCGKSTLFRCILGTLPLDSGNIEFNAQSLKDFGYMPQELCLDENLTIKETFEYYGTLYAMCKTHIAKRIYELTKLLKLPDSNNFIGNLSGGQSRRVSLAISILHDPKIILMDEPTVGIDSLIRHEIWKEFENMVEKHKKTIIITTHYIEEANLANKIGLMRNGVVIEEGSPQQILNKHNSDSLESAFLKLCYNERENQVVSHSDCGGLVNRDNTPQTKKLTTLENKFSFNRVKALMNKHLNLYSRDYVLIFTMFIVPIMQGLIFCNCIGTEIKGMKIAIKNDEIDFWDARRSNIDGCILDEKNDQKISGVMMNHLESFGYVLDEVADRKAGEMIMINSSKYVAFIHFPKNYTEAFSNFMDDYENYDFYSNLYMVLDKYNFLFKNKIIFDMKDTMDFTVENILSGCSYKGKKVKSLSLPMEFVATVGKEVKSFSHSLASIFIAMAASYFPCVFSVSIMLQERMDGILQRSMLAGVKVLEMMLSLFVISSGILIMEMITPVLVVYVLYQYPIQVTNGLVAYGLLIVFLGWTGFFFGLIVACVSPTKLMGMAIIHGYAFMQALLSGAIWPAETQATLLKIVSEFLPVRLVGNLMTDISLKGWTLDHPLVIKKVVEIFFYNIILVLILISLGKLKKNMWTSK